ncbi:uncharacterized protein LOC125179009, partial [Hyalella azteca]|uniref:Uncharacterized protein LOC125179009 n=1 Tax=Hyalella azteca TaxID=294128 RepID=A0A979FS55_HYAAZ
MLASLDDIAPRDDRTREVLRQKHPPAPEDLTLPEPAGEDYPPPSIVGEGDVRKAIASFRPGSAGGPDGLRPGHLVALISRKAGEAGARLLASLTGSSQGLKISQGHKSSQVLKISQGHKSSQSLKISRGHKSSQGLKISRGHKSSQSLKISRGHKSSQGLKSSQGYKSSQGLKISQGHSYPEGKSIEYLESNSLPQIAHEIFVSRSLSVGIVGADSLSCGIHDYKNSSALHVMGERRIFGALPFKPKCQDECNGTKNVECTVKLQKNKYWESWSAFWTLTILAVMVVDTYYAATDPRGKLVGCKTMVFAHMNCDITTGVTVALLQMIFWRQSDQLAQIWNHVNSLGQKVSLNYAFTAVLAFIIIFPAAANAIVYILFLRNYTPAISLVAACSKAMLIAFFYLILAIIYHHGMQITGSYLMTVLQPITETFKKEMENRSHRINWHSPNDVENNQTKISNIQPLDYQNTRSTKSEIGKNRRLLLPILVKNAWHETELQLMKDEILDAYCLLADIKTYCERPLAVVMYCLIIWLLTSAFYLTLWPVMKIQQRIVGSSHLVVAVVPLFYLLNSNHCLRKQLYHMKWMLTYLAHRKTNTYEYKKEQ